MINLTQHNATTDQLAVGVIDLQGQQLALVKALLTFDEIPTESEMKERADKIAEIARKHGVAAMIGGAPFFMSYLERALHKVSVTPYYAFSKRCVIKDEDGVKERIIFKHEGFVDAFWDGNY